MLQILINASHSPARRTLICVIANLQIGKLEHDEVKCLVYSHPGIQWLLGTSLELWLAPSFLP